MAPGKISLKLIQTTIGFFVLLAISLAACSLPAAELPPQLPPEPLELLKQLNRVALDPTQIYAIRDAHITRGGMDLYLNRGFIAFMTPVLNKVTGAIFWGEGEVLAIPRDTTEKQSLSQFTHAPILDERIESIYLRFTDNTAQELLASSAKPDPDDPEQPGPVVERWAAVAEPMNMESSVRILADLLGSHDHPYFHARVNGENLGVFEITDDERLPEPFSIASLGKVGSRSFTDVWCSFLPQSGSSGAAASLASPARALDYTLDVQIHPDHRLDGRAEIQLESHSAQDRVISFDLSRWLAVSSVQDDEGHNIAVIGGEPTDGDVTKPRAYDHVDVVLPRPYPVGANFRLVFNYHGNVIADVGNGVLYVGARGTWYPNMDLGFPCQYDMTFHYPRKLTLVATGERIEENTSEQETESRWKSDGIFRMAGFNLGTYISAERKAGKTDVTVYALKEVERSLEIRHDMQRETPLAISEMRGPVMDPVHARPLPLEPSAALGKVADIAAQAVQYFSTLFGPYPYPRVAIAQAPGNFGQGWPELVYLPTMTFLPKSQRVELGLDPEGDDPMGPAIIAHEISHQWWGNLLDWQTYHDQWLSEGLASYSAALFLAQGKDGTRKFHDLLRLYKHDLLGKTSEGSTVESGGPIWLGQRLSSSKDPDGYSNIVYKKACWVLNMLRAVMTDGRTGSDASFFRMLRDFAVQYQGQSVSTEDFIHHAEKYMTPENDLEHNRKLDWFFNEWVYGTGIPEYTLKSDVQALPAGGYKVQGTIAQGGVPADFEMPVGLLAVYPGNKRTTLVRVVVSGDGAHFRFITPRKPLRVTVDEDDLLAVVR
jgi:hypothetical protein